jgi:hypothetical protein
MAVLRAIELLSVEGTRHGLSIDGEVVHAAANAYLEEKQSERRVQEGRNEVSRHDVHRGLLLPLRTHVGHQNPLMYVQVLQHNLHALIVIDALDGLFKIELYSGKRQPFSPAVETYMYVSSRGYKRYSIPFLYASVKNSDRKDQGQR